MAKCIKVEREKAEKTRRQLAASGAIDAGLMPARDSEYVYFPLVKGAKLPKGARTVEMKVSARAGGAKSLSDALEGKLSAAELDELVKSFDLVGDIAVVEIPEGLQAKEKLIAAAIMEHQHGVKVVAKKIGGTSGEFRIRPVKVIGGELRTSTIYREAGCQFELDLNKTYFSPRLGTERGRIAALVKPNERVLVPFAGVGPFAIRISKAVPSAQVVGIELNPEAADFFRKNVARNKCKNVDVVEGDARNMPKKYASWADRMAMPLPMDASHFLEFAIPCVKKGGILHYYSFSETAAPFEKAEKEALSAAKKAGRRATVIFRRVVRPYSRTTEQVVVDVRLD
jgi:tRNA (guanine37-N1)-methyltransferase